MKEGWIGDIILLGESEGIELTETKVAGRYINITIVVYERQRLFSPYLNSSVPSF